MDLQSVVIVTPAEGPNAAQGAARIEALQREAGAQLKVRPSPKFRVVNTVRACDCHCHGLLAAVARQGLTVTYILTGGQGWNTMGSPWRDVGSYDGAPLGRRLGFTLQGEGFT